MQETWDEYWKGRDAFNVERIIESDSYYRLLKRLIDPPRDRNLEVGCGSGIRTLALLREFQNYRLRTTLCDLSPSALAFARKNADHNRIAANFALADAFKLPFPDKSFDIVWNEWVNEHYHGGDRQLIFNEMARVCKPGGQVVVVVPNALNPPYRLWKKVLEIQGRWEYGFEKLYSIFELRNKMKNAGLILTKAGGMKIMSSFFCLTELIPKKRANKAANARQTAYSGGLGSAFRKVEGFLEKVIWFAGGNIGIKGVKCG